MSSKTELGYAVEVLANSKSDNELAEIFRMAITGTMAIPLAQYSMKLSPAIMEQHLKQVSICTDIMNDIKNKVRNEFVFKEVK